MKSMSSTDEFTNGFHVDENGIVYVVDRLQGGLDILELNI